jgi:YegS/Rv2252/BmrU family lipid kinase
MNENALREVLVLVNPKSGLYTSFGAMRRALDETWDLEGSNLKYQFSQSKEDGMAKVGRAVHQGVDTVLVLGGDGTINSIGRMLVDTDVTLGVIPGGSGNGFARDFGIPLSPSRAVRTLATAHVKRIDVGIVNDMPFLVTCGMAWDASLMRQLMRQFEKLPVRGILPYVFAGVQEFFEYRPQKMEAVIDSDEVLSFPDPLMFTVANLTQWGGGAKIAPHARPDDGLLELVVARRKDTALLVTNFPRWFDGTLDSMPQIVSRRFKSLVVRREHPAPIQIDGEVMVDAPAHVEVTVKAAALNVLVPGGE